MEYQGEWSSCGHEYRMGYILQGTGDEETRGDGNMLMLMKRVLMQDFD